MPFCFTTHDDDTLVFVLLSPNWINSRWLLIIGNRDVTDPSSAEDDIHIKFKQADQFSNLSFNHPIYIH